MLWWLIVTGFRKISHIQQMNINFIAKLSSGNFQSTLWWLLYTRIMWNTLKVSTGGCNLFWCDKKTDFPELSHNSFLNHSSNSSRNMTQFFQLPIMLEYYGCMPTNFHRPNHDMLMWVFSGSRGWELHKWNLSLAQN